MANKSSHKPSVLLQRSLNLFGDGGKRWTKGSYRLRVGQDQEYPEGAFCAVGVLEKVDTSRMYEASNYLKKVIPKHFRTIERWNDSPKRSWREVKTAFQKAIRLAEKEGN